MAILFFLFVSCVLHLPLAQSQSKSGEQCTTPKVSKVVFSYSSYPNENGQWKSQIGLQHEGAQLSANKTSPWSLDVEQNTIRNCGGEDTIHMVANMSTGLAPPTKKPPPADYEFFPNMGWYKFHTQGASWSSARDKCADEGAHLLIVNSEAEAGVMKQLFAKTSKTLITAARKDAMWVGIVEGPGARNYNTIFGEPLASTGFSRWSTGDPDATNGCVFLYEGNLGLADASPCTVLYPFVCEIGL